MENLDLVPFASPPVEVRRTAMVDARLALQRASESRRGLAIALDFDLAAETFAQFVSLRDLAAGSKILLKV